MKNDENEKITVDHLTDYFDAYIINPHTETRRLGEGPLSEYEIEKRKFQEWKRKMDDI
ncbi:MAG: hypothetical protein JJU16_09180 [Alkalibacterium sp.]|nr:hypothetical protein [Alkalibacterium sp.]